MFEKSVITSAVLAAAAAVSTPANAVTTAVWLQANGSGVCQAALPSFEGQIRKRPLAIQNEGTADAFVTCSPTSAQFTQIEDFGHGIYIANDSGASTTVTCTGVMGSANWDTEFSVKSVEIAGGSIGEIYWTAEDFPNNAPDNQTAFNTSCRLVPGVGIRTLYTNHQLEIGS